jgi:hypothetical protein
VAPSQASVAPVKEAAGQVAFGVFGAILLGSAWYYGFGLLHRIDAVEGSGIITGIQYTGVGLMAFVAVFGGIAQIVRARQALRAQRAAHLVAATLGRIKEESPTTNVEAIPAEELAGLVRGAKVSSEHLVRLVEQGRQRLLIDEDSFRTEVAGLIVDFLQPLPRNAKRVLNRFRVDLLIADRRGLFRSEPMVSKQQIGKWLVLAERWPQLRLSLSAAPERMQSLEELAAKRASVNEDPFMKEIGGLAPFYVGDEDLRRFIHTSPHLAPILPRLVHYGDPAAPGKAHS